MTWDRDNDPTWSEVTEHDHEEWQNALDTLPQLEEEEGDNYSPDKPRIVAPSNL